MSNFDSDTQSVRIKLEKSGPDQQLIDLSEATTLANLPKKTNKNDFLGVIYTESKDVYEVVTLDTHTYDEVHETYIEHKIIVANTNVLNRIKSGFNNN